MTKPYCYQARCDRPRCRRFTGVLSERMRVSIPCVCAHCGKTLTAYRMPDVWAKQFILSLGGNRTKESTPS